MIDIKQQLQKFRIQPRGVIHVGAHKASEHQSYLALGFSKILYIEANPSLYAELEERFRNDPLVLLANVAITDENGEIDFRVTSSDQSSSILALKDHLNIYPEIKQVNQIRVTARTLDHLFLEREWDPRDFNFINIDIQGAELLALRGALRILQNIDALNTEINHVELYENCVLFPDLENFLSLLGFNRTEMISPYHSSWGDAFYVKRPVVQMTSLGNNGGFGNQLFQYAYLRILSEEKGLVVQTAPWIGQEVFEIKDPVPITERPTLFESPFSPARGASSCLTFDPRNLLKKDRNILPSINIWGYFQPHTSEYRRFKELIENTFIFNKEIKQSLEKAFLVLNPARKKVITVHLRRGDYGCGIFYKAPCSWYAEWLEGISSKSDYLVYVSSEQPSTYLSRFKGFDVVSRESISVRLDSTIAMIIDFYFCTVADKLLISNSSFSFFGALLNHNASDYLRPCLDKRAMIRFDPWNSHVLDQQVLTDAEHDFLSTLD